MKLTPPLVECGCKLCCIVSAAWAQVLRRLPMGCPTRRRVDLARLPDRQSSAVSVPQGRFAAATAGAPNSFRGIDGCMCETPLRGCVASEELRRVRPCEYQEDGVNPRGRLEGEQPWCGPRGGMAPLLAPPKCCNLGLTYSVCKRSCRGKPPELMTPMLEEVGLVQRCFYNTTNF